MLGEEIAKDYFKADDPAFSLITGLFQALEMGELFLPLKNPLPQSFRKILKEGAPFRVSENRLYLERDFVMEEKFFQKWKELLEEGALSPLSESDLSSYPLTESQRNISTNIFGKPLEILTGGPGTGKTFVAASWISAFVRKFPKAQVVIAAPTGKATANLRNRFSEMHNIRAVTLHRLLFEAKNLGRISEDLIVVDEASMVDLSNMLSLFQKKKKGARLLLIGDPFQLPPVERGFIFRDMTLKGEVRRLTECLRAEVRDISLLAEAIREGDFDRTLSLLSTSSAIQWKESFDEALSPPFLSATRKGPFGVDTLNRKLFEKSISKDRFPIILTRNLPEMGLANGDQGELIVKNRRTLQSILQPTVFDRALFLGRAFPANLLPPFDLGFALSIHKSQGSESDFPTILLGEGAERFPRSLLYTAVTRAKKGLVLIAKREIIQALFNKS